MWRWTANECEKVLYAVAVSRHSPSPDYTYQPTDVDVQGDLVDFTRGVTEIGGFSSMYFHSYIGEIKEVRLSGDTTGDIKRVMIFDGKSLYTFTTSAFGGLSRDILCRPGYTGTKCSEACTSGWGYECKDCQCADQSTCDRLTGWCENKLCVGRFHEPYCDWTCDVDSFGADCSMKTADSEGCTGLSICKTGCGKYMNSSTRITHCVDECSDNYGPKRSACPKWCNCINDGDCNRKTGQCNNGQCEAGFYSGDLGDCQESCHDVDDADEKPNDCAEVCSIGFFGTHPFCNGLCTCRDATQCRPTDGVCRDNKCYIGYMGYRCGDKCIYGKNCKKRCHCLNDELCDVTTGECPNGCHLRYTGDACQKTCHEDYYMDKETGDCSRRCNCKRPDLCSVSDGRCASTGCAYGPGCDKDCHCLDGEPCDEVTGKCDQCDVRYYGEICQETCSKNKYLNPRGHCLEDCHCFDNVNCFALNGNCRGGDCAAGWYLDCKTPCKESKYGIGCIRNCHCASGTCNPQTGRCPGSCTLRHYGEICQKTCSRGKYNRRRKCDGVCHCRNPNACNVTSGECDVCAAGWSGKACQDPCRAWTWGQNCSETCHCKDNDICTTVSGRCHGGCSARYHGISCNETCPENTHLAGNRLGSDCVGTCLCAKQEYCRVTDGLCVQGGCLTSGHDAGQGKCLEPCKGAIEKYGDACQHTCHCDTPNDCGRLTGTCKGCDTLYFGITCQQTCSPGMFLPDVITGTCSKTCKCANNDQCRARDGECMDQRCNPGWRGKKCDDPCEIGYFGLDCASRCHCFNGSACSPQGECPNGECARKFKGKSCNEVCPKNRYLVEGKCDGICFCNESAECDIRDGSCGASGCIQDRHGPKCTLDCHCAEGTHCDNHGDCGSGGCATRYGGEKCQKTCPPNTYGLPNCSGTCHCKDNKKCSVEDGDCGGQCENVRHTGFRCHVECKPGTYVVVDRCTGLCHCENPDECDITSGECGDSGCAAGWSGSRCHLTCDAGLWGPKCSKKCMCKENDPCDPHSGICPRGCVDGRTGKTCEQTASPKTSAKNMVIYAGVGLFFVVMGAIGIFVYVSHRVRKRRDVDEEDPNKASFLAEMSHNSFPALDNPEVLSDRQNSDETKKSTRHRGSHKKRKSENKERDPSVSEETAAAPTANTTANTTRRKSRRRRTSQFPQSETGQPSEIQSVRGSVRGSQSKSRKRRRSQACDKD